MSVSVMAELDTKSADRLPCDWKNRIGAYRGAPAAHYQRVLRKLSLNCDWMTDDERERAAFVIVEKELLREQGHEEEDED